MTLFLLPSPTDLLVKSPSIDKGDTIFPLFNLYATYPRFPQDVRVLFMQSDGGLTPVKE